MRKLYVFFIAFALLTLTSNATISVSTPNPEPLYELGYGVKVSMAQLMTMTPKEYKKLTGHSLGLTKSIALKVVQKKLKKAPYGSGSKSQLTAALLCFFLGGLGIHRFYLGYTWQGIVQLLTLGGLGIWSLIDFIRILTGGLQPKDGEYDKPL